jgi:hypothetical protein
MPVESLYIDGDTIFIEFRKLYIALVWRLVGAGGEMRPGGRPPTRPAADKTRTKSSAVRLRVIPSFSHSAAMGLFVGSTNP